MSNQDERLGSLLILSDLALILSTYGVLLAFNYFIEPINTNTWIICTFFVGIKILIVGISDITGIGRYYIVSLLFVLMADVIIFLINQLMSFSLSLRLILLMTACDLIMVIIAIFIWKRITKQNFRPIEPEGISWEEEIEPGVDGQPALETGNAAGEYQFETIEPQVTDTIISKDVENRQTESKPKNRTFLQFDEITDELPTQEEIEKQMAYDNMLGGEFTEFEDTFTTNAPEEDVFSNINLFTSEEPIEQPGEGLQEDIIFTTEGMAEEPQELPTLEELSFDTEPQITQPEVSEIEALEEDTEIVEEVPEEPIIEKVEEPVFEKVEEPVFNEPIFSTEETVFDNVEEPIEVEDVTVSEAVEPEEEKVETIDEPEPEVQMPAEEEILWGPIINEALTEEKSEVEALGEADIIEEKATKPAEPIEEDIFSIPLFEEKETETVEETPVIMTTAEEVEEEPEAEEFFVENIYDYNEITNSTIGFNKRFSPIPFNVTQEQLDSLVTDVKLEMIRFNSNLSKLIDAYNDSLAPENSYQKINDMITLTDQDSISDADRIIRNKIDLLNQKDFISTNLIHNFVEIINKLNNRVYSIEIAQENLNEKQKLEREREAEKQRQQTMWQENRTPRRSPFNPYSRETVSSNQEPKKAEEPVLNESEVLLRNDDMDIIIDSADLELLKEFMAQQEKND